MKKHFKLIDLDCANCAAKMEAAIKKLDGVHDATVSFMTQKLTLDADDTRFDEILNVEFEDGQEPKAVMQAVLKACKKVEPDCTIVR